MISILKTDFYKATHLMQYQDGITHFTSYLTPRNSRFKSIDKMVVFGIANFVSKYLYEDFNRKFFCRTVGEISNDVNDVLYNGLGYSGESVQKTLKKILSLYKLGYLPIEINSLPEGTLCPMQVPAIEIRSTHKDFAWVAQAIESLLSCEIWHPIMSATIGLEYKKIAKKAFEETVDDNISHMTAMCDFSMRGQESYESAVASGAAFLMSFNNSSTIESREYIRKNYEEEKVKVNGLTSTEHSVMCSDFAITRDERETYRRLLTEVYPTTSFAAVCDSYDFWNVVTNILPTLREEIEAHEGFIGIRHDADEPVHALCGIRTYNLNELYGEDSDVLDSIIDDEDSFLEYVGNWVNEEPEFFCSEGIKKETIYVEYTKNRGENYNPIIFSGVFQLHILWGTERGAYTDCSYKFVDTISVEKIRDERTWEDKGMVETLYEIFGGSFNTKGYKVINPKLKAVYGDSITIPRAKEIYRRLKIKGFAANNVSLGVGSFSMECLEEDGKFLPFTRDSFSIAIKATHGKYINENGEEIEFPIFKNPKGCSEKKSLTGLCVPYTDMNGNLNVRQKLTEEQYEHFKECSAFVPYFKDGKVFKYSFNTIRKRMEDNCNGKV